VIGCGIGHPGENGVEGPLVGRQGEDSQRRDNTLGDSDGSSFR